MPYYDSVPYQCRWKRFPRQPLLIGFGAMVLMMTGAMPTLRWNASLPVLDFGQRAIAQTIDEDELLRYARSVLVIEPMRQNAYDEIKRILGNDEVPPIACHRPNSLDNLRPNIRQIAVNYCNRAIEVVEENDLTISRFNAITTSMQDNRALAQQVQQLLLQELQRGHN